MTGILIKGVGGLYTVFCEGISYPAKARGKFRKDRTNSQKPVIGDRVDFTPANGGEDFGTIDRIYERKNRLIRPAVSNIDLLLAVIACASPEPDLLLIDKLLLYARLAGVSAVVVMNKTDLGEPEGMADEYVKSGYEVFRVSASSGDGLGNLRARMAGSVSAYAGQSAVGKSSILNAICGDFDIATGGVSKINRGRHTTRHVELLPLGEDTWVCDTPGFSLLEMETFDPEKLKELYAEFEPYEGECRFLGCNHINEPGCAVKAAAENGTLSAERLARYARIFAEIKEKWSGRYD